MNGRQTVALWAGVLVVALMGLFPPWLCSGKDWRVSAGYRPIVSPPPMEPPPAPQYLASLWEMERDPDFQALPPKDQDEVRQLFFTQRVEPDPDFQARSSRERTEIANRIPGVARAIPSVVGEPCPSSRIDITRLIIQTAVVALITVGLMVSLRGGYEGAPR